jgi:hypothetical protein
MTNDCCNVSSARVLSHTAVAHKRYCRAAVRMPMPLRRSETPLQPGDGDSPDTIDALTLGCLTRQPMMSHHGEYTSIERCSISPLFRQFDDFG